MAPRVLSFSKSEVCFTARAFLADTSAMGKSRCPIMDRVDIVASLRVAVEPGGKGAKGDKAGKGEGR